MAKKKVFEEWKSGYEWSRDYDRLKHLLDNGYEVMCRADYRIGNDIQAQHDPCIARLLNDYDDEYVAMARGIQYMSFRPSFVRRYERYPRTFAEMCEASNLEFIDFKEKED